MSVVVNSSGAKRTYDPEDFMPKKPERQKLLSDDEQEERRMTPEETAHTFKMLAISMGGKIVEADE
jgi:hypothetical protein